MSAQGKLLLETTNKHFKNNMLSSIGKSQSSMYCDLGPIHNLSFKGERGTSLPKNVVSTKVKRVQ